MQRPWAAGWLPVRDGADRGSRVAPPMGGERVVASGPELWTCGYPPDLSRSP